jgi:hypothetical protein
MSRALLDTDILSEVLKNRDAAVVREAQAYLVQHGEFTVSVTDRSSAGGPRCPCTAGSPECVRGAGGRRAAKRPHRRRTYAVL